MNETIRKILVFVVFIATVIWAFATFSGRDAKKTPGRHHRVEEVETESAMPRPAPGLDRETIEEYSTIPWGKDPFYHSLRPGGASPVPGKVRLHLLGILYREINARALINDRIVGEGDSVAGFTVEKITRDYVTLSNGKETIRLQVEKERS